MSVLLHQLALISESEAISTSELLQVAAALQKQASRDFGPLWKVQATVDAFDRLEDVPLGYWPLIVRDDIRVQGAAGIHLDDDGQPFALIQYSSSWSLTASHEMLEMLADPFGSRVMAGPSIKRGQGRVEYLVEVCDPSEDSQFAYTVNDILVSDFYTPHFFDPIKANGVRYSFSGAITAPRQVLPGGYLSWHDPVSDHWWQFTSFGEKTFRDLGVLGQLTGSIRAVIDGLTPHLQLDEGVRAEGKGAGSVLFAASLQRAESTRSSTSKKAQMWHERIETLKRPPA